MTQRYSVKGTQWTRMSPIVSLVFCSWERTLRVRPSLPKKDRKDFPTRPTFVFKWLERDRRSETHILVIRLTVTTFVGDPGRTQICLYRMTYRLHWVIHELYRNKKLPFYFYVYIKKGSYSLVIDSLLLLFLELYTLHKCRLPYTPELTSPIPYLKISNRREGNPFGVRPLKTTNQLFLTPY